MYLKGPNRRALLAGAAGALAAVWVSGCTRGPDPYLPVFVVATGPPGAVYREIGAEIAALLAERMPDTEVEAVETGASHDNLHLLEAGEAHLGLANLDSVLAEEVATAASPLRAIGRLYDSFVHLAVLDGSPVRRLGDLEGLRVSVGAVNSGTEFTATQLLEETGLDVDEVRMNQAESADALGAGEIDAMFSLTGLPTPAVSDLAERHVIRLVDLSDTADVMAGVHPEAYLPATIPATTYQGVPACPTMSVPNLLLCPADLPDNLAALVTETVYTGASRLADTRPEAAQINVRTGISTGVVPLHPGAVRWYRRNKPS